MLNLLLSFNLEEDAKLAAKFELEKVIIFIKKNFQSFFFFF